MKSALRWLFAVLVLVNLGVVMWASWYRAPAVPVPKLPLPPIHPDKIVPLSVPGLDLRRLPPRVDAKPSLSAALAPVTGKPAPQTPSVSQVMQPPQPLPRQCLTIGPFDTDAAAQNAGVQLLKTVGVGYSMRKQEDKVASSYWVYLPPRSSQRAAELTLKRLDRKGIRDHIIVQEPGMNNAISLGLYTLPKNARIRVEELARKGVHAKQQVRYRQRIRYWMDVEIDQSGQVVRLKSEDWGTPGVGVKDVPCVTSAAPVNGTPAVLPLAPAPGAVVAPAKRSNGAAR
ncbi:MAG: hypothetical protein ACYDDO_11695 [Acidiferrobacterales bacterium]